MNGFFAPAMSADRVMSSALRVHAVQGDGMFPLLRGSMDYVLVAPVDTYRGEGIYLFHNGLGEDLSRVTSAWDGKKSLCLSKENDRYSSFTVPLDKFNESVLAIVVADIKVRDERFLRN